MGLILFVLIAVARGHTRAERPAAANLLALIGAFALLPACSRCRSMRRCGTTRFVSAYFEMVSSFTTTGATLYEPGGCRRR